MNSRFHATFTLLSTVVVLLAIGWGFRLVGSPATRRLERFDEQRVRDLQTIAREIQWMVLDRNEKGTLKEALPATLEQAAEMARGQQINLRDPETDEPYGYTVKNETTFELCARFSGERRRGREVFWNHPAGSQCFTINVLDPPPN